MAIFFTSDTHFGHAGALALYRRPFASVAAMDEGLVERWNEAVGPADEVWHLGDFAIRQSAERVADLLARLHGRKHLVAGNNDPPATLGLAGWSSVQPYAELMIDERRLVLCHYAFRTWRDMSRGAVNLHGHSHGRLKPLPRQIDVGVDAWDFRPQTLSALLARRAPAPTALTEPAADDGGKPSDQPLNLHSSSFGSALSMAARKGTQRGGGCFCQ